MIGLIALKNRIKECLSDTVFSKTIWLIPWPKEKKNYIGMVEKVMIPRPVTEK